MYKEKRTFPKLQMKTKDICSKEILRNEYIKVFNVEVHMNCLNRMFKRKADAKLDFSKFLLTLKRWCDFAETMTVVLVDNVETANIMHAFEKWLAGIQEKDLGRLSRLKSLKILYRGRELSIQRK